MSDSYTFSSTTTFTITHAKHIGAKVATDLKRMQRLYGSPSDTDIANYEAEIVEFLKQGYLGTVTYGFRRDCNWVEPTLRYTVRDFADSSEDDDPGRIRPGANIANASFYSYLTYSPAWDRSSDVDKQSFVDRLPFRRGGAFEPGVSGYLASDRTYSAGGRALVRGSVRSFS
jgi:hypothetical protein